VDTHIDLRTSGYWVKAVVISPQVRPRVSLNAELGTPRVPADFADKEGIGRVEFRTTAGSGTWQRLLRARKKLE